VINRIKIIIYYIFVKHIPNSRYCSFFNSFRVWYLQSVLRILKKDRRNKFQENIYIGDASKIRIGAGVQINEGVFIQGAIIGDYVMVAPNVTILSSKHNHKRLDIPMVFQGEEKDLIVTIEDDVWLGRNVLVMPGVTIKRGAIVAAGAVVTCDVPELSIVAGIPARVIKYRND
jgi:maltose O-acetyltransferase